MTEPTPRVARVADRDRYEISLGEEPAGFTAYRDRGERRVFHHTEIADAFGGRGLGSTLIAAALNDTREAGLRVVPVCPFVATYLQKHDEFADIVDPVNREVLGWLRETLD